MSTLLIVCVVSAARNVAKGAVIGLVKELLSIGYLLHIDVDHNQSSRRQISSSYRIPNPHREPHLFNPVFQAPLSSSIIPAVSHPGLKHS